MDRFELDQLAMETKANGSSFPLLLKNSKHIIDRVVSTWLDTTGSTPNLRGVHNSTITLPKSSFEHLSFIKRRGCSPFNDCLVL